MPTLDTYRKQAKELVRWHAQGDLSVGGRVRRLPRFTALSDREVLARPFPLGLAQEVIAVEAGHASWAELKVAADAHPRTAPKAGARPTLVSAAPVLLVRDVPVSARFFHDALGFAVDFLHGAPAFYGSVSRDGASLHLRHVGRPPFAAAAAEEPSLIACLIEVTDVQALFREYEARGVAFAQPLVRHPWGGTDFHVRDPDGNVVAFVGYPRGRR